MIGNKIRELREKKGISTRDFASRLDIDISTLNRIENGKINSFKPALLQKIAKSLNVGLAELFDQNATIAIQQNEKGNNINVLNQEIKSEKIQELYEELLKTKDTLIANLQQQIEFLKTQSSK